MLFQAIVTKYMGPTDFRGARVKATCDAGTFTMSWDHELNASENHMLAATALANKFGWITSECSLVQGSMPQKTPYAYCFVQVVK